MFIAKEISYLPNDISLIQKGTLFGSEQAPIIFQIQSGEFEQPLTVRINVSIATASAESDLLPMENNIATLNIKRNKDTPTYSIDRIGLASHNASDSLLSLRFLITPLSEATFFVFNYELYSQTSQIPIHQESGEVQA